MAAKSKTTLFEELKPKRFIEPLLVALVIAALSGNGLLQVNNFRRLQENRSQLRDNKRVLIKIEETLLAVTDAETGQRGYVITGDESYLEPFEEAMSRIDGLLNELGEMSQTVPEQRATFADLRRKVEQKIGELKEVIEVRRDEGTEAAAELLTTDIGMRTMEKIRALAERMRGVERIALERREASASQTYRRGFVTSIFSTLAGLALVGGVIYLIQRSRRRSERSARTIQAARDHLRVTLASIGDGVITTDSEGRVAFLNGVAEQLTGWEDAEARGAPLRSVFQTIDETTRQPIDSPASPAQGEGLPNGGANHTLLVARDGVETPIDDSVAPIRGEDGETRGVVLVFRDVTQRREDEIRLQEASMQRSLDVRELGLALSKLRTAEERFRLALDAADLGSWNINPATSELVADERFWRHFTGGEEKLDYEAAFAAIHPDDRERIRAAVAASLSIDDPAPYAEEYRVVHPDGAVRWLLGKGSAHFRQVEGVHQLVSFDGTVSDITERKRTEQAIARLTANLTAADRNKDEFLATLAHELRNPLAPIKNAVQLMAMSPLDEETEALRQTMERQVEQLVHLIDDLLDVSRISRGKITLRKETIGLASVVEAAVEAAASLIEANEQTLRVDYKAEGLAVDADAARLTQVVSNLLNNAAKYSDAGGQIKLVVREADGQAVVEVHDDGVGIEPEYLEQIFTMFSQLDQSLERGSAGLGIGLTLVKSLVEMHGGTITVRSEGQGRGSVFAITLPLSDRQPAPVQAPAATDPASFTAYRVLVVEDQAALRIVLGKLLEKMGHTVEGADGGEQALAKFAEFAPDVVISDISMPGMSGYDLVRSLRELPDAEGVLLVAITGYGQESDRRMAMEAGFHEHLVKPADARQLEAIFSRLTAKRLGRDRDVGGAE
ncbi:Aerobic respiration control sensor protein ArcB [Botrimarina colliarenosi]|uniref:histidine kinase n=1 Tax=Botrimarina colliarenosi TaxID=2528001 RepID=A0A5C6A286_9BACT|nr:CHASE3 domain-containing protein [Botrimarina colliarenosi]TWT93450.1 Aerobic respiration control sensor protein ArcB [Botrimarina colliarenosi]